MKQVAYSLALLIGLAACGSGTIRNRTQDAHLNASFACMGFEFVFPTKSAKKIAFTSRQRLDQISQAAGQARTAAKENKKWSADARALDALAAGMLDENAAVIVASVAQVHKLCDPLNEANGISR